MIWADEGNAEGDLLDGHVLLQYVVGVDRETVMGGDQPHQQQPDRQAARWPGRQLG